MHTACHQVCLDRKSLNTKRLSPYSRSKSVAESFRGWDWLFRFWDARCNTATQSEYVAVFGKRIIADNLSKAGWSWGYISAIDSEGRTIWIADAHRCDGKRYVVRADEKLTAFIELESATRLLELRMRSPLVSAQRGQIFENFVPRTPYW